MITVENSLLEPNLWRPEAILRIQRTAPKDILLKIHPSVQRKLDLYDALIHNDTARQAALQNWTNYLHYADGLVDGYFGNDLEHLSTIVIFVPFILLSAAGFDITEDDVSEDILRVLYMIMQKNGVSFVPAPNVTGTVYGGNLGWLNKLIVSVLDNKEKKLYTAELTRWRQSLGTSKVVDNFPQEVAIQNMLYIYADQGFLPLHAGAPALLPDFTHVIRRT